MPKCTDQNFPCQNPVYLDFDKITEAELKNPTPASSIVNESWFCSSVPTNEIPQIGDLTSSKFLRPLGGKFGIYHLWSEYEHCDDHSTHTMRCEYVGKGTPNIRIASHIREKWPEDLALFVTFHEFENRLAKYYEQLFLDTYQFNMNDNENHGTKTLYAVWDEERFSTGTHINEISNYSKMDSPDDW